MTELSVLTNLLQGSPTAVVLLVAWVIYLRNKPKSEGPKCAEHEQRMALMEREQSDRNKELKEFKEQVRADFRELREMIESGFTRINERIDNLKDK